MRGADLVVQTLAEAGVKVIFSLSGNQIMPLYDACIDAGLRVIHTRHECAAVFMADAYAQITGEVGIALVTAAPGFANALGGLYSARMAESPVVLLSGDSPLAQDGRRPFQELDQTAISAPLTKASLRSRRTDALGSDVAQAIRTALSGRPGPVHLALPFDLVNGDAGSATPPAAASMAPERMPPDPEAVQALAQALAQAQRPVVLTGPALNGTRAGALLQELAAATAAPVVPMESPRGLNDPCLGAFKEILATADLVVSLGKELDFTTGFATPPAVAEDCRIMIVDPDGDVLERARRAAGERLALAARGDAPATARALAKAGRGGQRDGYISEVERAIAARIAVEDTGDDGALHPATLCAGVQKLMDEADEAILVIDGGEFGQWAQAFLAGHPRIINGPSGAIGGALCYAVGAKIARPEARVVALMGDGTIGFHLAEFETAKRCGADFLAVIGNDARWNAEYQIQLRDYGPGRTYACELSAARYDEAVAGLGGHGEHVGCADGLEAALARAAASGLPACVNVEIEGLAAPAAPAH